jgi:cytochrome P450
VISVVVFGELPRETYLELTGRLAAFLNDSKFNLALIGQLDSNVGTSPTWDAFRGSLAHIRALLASELVRRRATERPADDDMLSMLLSARYADGTQMSDESLVDELLTMVVTGYETTATALAWALYWTHRDEGTLAWWTDAARDLAPAEAHTNERVSSLCREVLRIHPVIPVVARRAQRPFTVGSRTYEAGTVLSPCIYLTHHREDLYPDPDAFRPDRFLARSYASHEYLPFGGGARRCIGMGLALMEMGIVLTVFAQRLVLELLTPEKLFAQRRSVTVAPSQSTPMRVLARS